MKQLLRPLTLLFLALVTIGCEDPVPTDYKPEVVVQAFLIVDQPIKDVQVYWSQPMTDSFSYQRATIRDAEVWVVEGAARYPLRYVGDTTGGHYEAADSAVRIRPLTTYRVEVRVGQAFVVGTTTTPDRIAWIKDLPPELDYPGRENELLPVDSLKVRWTIPAPGMEYVLRMTCLDTLNYGTYLTPPTDETNGRIRDKELVDENEPLGRLPVRLAFVQAPDVFSWAAFKYFGMHEFSVYAGDRNFVNWFKQITFTRQYNELLNSVTGGIGVVGSASVVHDTVFVRR
ncbi:MAG: DUF4249 family protein [Candidatus Kapabacteria bacterium]|nr:DUF4249 family protein [Candidatus Kapabacteria bacterium]